MCFLLKARQSSLHGLFMLIQMGTLHTNVCVHIEMYTRTHTHSHTPSAAHLQEVSGLQPKARPLSGKQLTPYESFTAGRSLTQAFVWL